MFSFSEEGLYTLVPPPTRTRNYCPETTTANPGHARLGDSHIAAYTYDVSPLSTSVQQKYVNQDIYSAGVKCHYGFTNPNVDSTTEGFPMKRPRLVILMYVIV